MEKAKNFSMMGQSLQVPTRKGSFKAKENILGQIRPLMKGIFQTVNLKVKLKNKYKSSLGKGVFTWYDGKRYEGDFLKGLMHGKGKLD
jgi:hypothetical protein